MHLIRLTMKMKYKYSPSQGNNYPCFSSWVRVHFDNNCCHLFGLGHRLTHSSHLQSFDLTSLICEITLGRAGDWNSVRRGKNSLEALMQSSWSRYPRCLRILLVRSIVREKNRFLAARGTAHCIQQAKVTRLIRWQTLDRTSGCDMQHRPPKRNQPLMIITNEPVSQEFPLFFLSSLTTYIISSSISLLHNLHWAMFIDQFTRRGRRIERNQAIEQREREKEEES